MYSIVEVAGEQTKVTQGQVLRVPKLDVEPGKSISFEKVMLIVNKDEVTIGNPLVANAEVKATVILHGKDKKVIVFKKKRRKTYRVLNGHRQDFSEIRIDSISVDKGKAEAKDEVKAAPVKEVPEKSKIAAKKTGSKTVTTKTTAVKKAPVTKNAEAKPVKKDMLKKSVTKEAAPKKGSTAKKGEEE